jgi:hypothetical protein
MTEQEIELEIQKRVQFKINEFKTALKNRVAIKWHIAANEMSRENQYIWEAFKEIEEILKKEINMPLPTQTEHNTMIRQHKWEAKEKAVKEMNEYWQELQGRNHSILNINRIVSIIEKAQNYL